MRDSLKMVRWQETSRILPIGDIQCELGLEWTENILREATRRGIRLSACMLECIPTRDGGWNGEPLKEKVIKASKALMGQKGKEMWRWLGKCCAEQKPEARWWSRGEKVRQCACMTEWWYATFARVTLTVTWDQPERTSLPVMSCICRCVIVFLDVCAHVYIYSRNSRKLALEAPRRFEAKQV